MLKDIKYNPNGTLIVLCAIAGSLTVTCFLLTAYYTENVLGSPSSTSCLIVPFLPIYISIGAIGGCILGLLLNKMIAHSKIQITANQFIPAGIVLIMSLAILAGLSGYWVVRHNLRLMTPHIVYSDASISKIATNEDFQTSDTLKISFEQRKQGKQMVWNGRKLTLSFPADQVRVKDASGNVIINSSLKQFDYICQLQANVVKLSQSEKPFLAVLADLRATSHRSVLLIYSSTNQLVYQEIFDTHGQTATIGIHKFGSDIDFLILRNGSETFSYTKEQN